MLIFCRWITLENFQVLKRLYYIVTFYLYKVCDSKSNFENGLHGFNVDDSTKFKF